MLRVPFAGATPKFRDHGVGNGPIRRTMRLRCFGARLAPLRDQRNDPALMARARDYLRDALLLRVPAAKALWLEAAQRGAAPKRRTRVASGAVYASVAAPASER